MQKTPLSLIMREEALRALVFGLSFFVILTSGFVGVAYAANGGIFGDILNKILASGNWEAPGDGTVKNSQKLGGLTVDNFTRNPSGGLVCPT